MKTQYRYNFSEYQERDPQRVFWWTNLGTLTCVWFLKHGIFQSEFECNPNACSMETTTEMCIHSVITWVLVTLDVFHSAWMIFHGFLDSYILYFARCQHFHIKCFFPKFCQVVLCSENHLATPNTIKKTWKSRKHWTCSTQTPWSETEYSSRGQNCTTFPKRHLAAAYVLFSVSASWIAGEMHFSWHTHTHTHTHTHIMSVSLWENKPFYMADGVCRFGTTRNRPQRFKNVPATSSPARWSHEDSDLTPFWAIHSTSRGRPSRKRVMAVVGLFFELTNHSFFSSESSRMIYPGYPGKLLAQPG